MPRETKVYGPLRDEQVADAFVALWRDGYRRISKFLRREIHTVSDNQTEIIRVYDVVGYPEDAEGSPPDDALMSVAA